MRRGGLRAESGCAAASSSSSSDESESDESKTLARNLRLRLGAPDVEGVVGPVDVESMRDTEDARELHGMSLLSSGAGDDSAATADNRNFILGSEGASSPVAGVPSFFLVDLASFDFVVFGRGAPGLRMGAFGTTMPANGFRHLAFPTSGDRNHTGPFGRAGPSNAFGCRAGSSACSAIDPESWYFVINGVLAGLAF